MAHCWMSQELRTEGRVGRRKLPSNAYLPPAENQSVEGKGEAKEREGMDHFSQYSNETHQLKILKQTVLYSDPWHQQTAFMWHSLHCHFDIVQAQRRKIWETHLLVLVTLTVVCSKAVQMLRPDVNSLKPYYVAKYCFRDLVLLTAAYSNLPNTSFGTPCTCCHGQHVPMASPSYVCSETVWLFAFRWCLSLQCKDMDLYRRKVKYYSNCTLPSLLHLVHFLYLIILTWCIFKRCHHLCTK